MNNSSGWRKKASQYHGKLKEVMIPYKNQVLQTGKIKEIIEQADDLHVDAQWIFPSDHCENHFNKGACYCAETKDALFNQIERGKYRVL